MARPRTHHEEKKQELIKIAFELFMKNGYENTSIQDIMHAAQISKGAMYHYFECKEDILDAVLHFIIDQDVKQFETVFNNPSLTVLEKLTATMLIDKSKAPEEVKQATEYVMERKDSIFDYRARELSKSRSIQGLTSLIREGVAKGEFHTAYPEEMAVFIAISGQSVGELFIRQASKEALLHAIDLFIQLIANCLGLEKKEQDFLADFLYKQFEKTE